MSVQHILVVGSINVDDGLRMRRLPGPGETVSATGTSTALGGKGANQAVAAALAGASVHMVGAVGRSDGATLLEQLDDHGVHTAGIARLEDVPSGRAVVMVDESGENAIVHIHGANNQVPDSEVDAACKALQEGDLLVLQNEIPSVISRRAARLARAAGARVLWNAAPAPVHRDDLLEDVDLLVVNQHELKQVADLLSLTGSDPGALVPAVAYALGADVVCTLGADGATYFLEGELGSGTSPRVDAIDTTAAGDTFVGYLAAMIDCPDRRCVLLPLTAGALAVTRTGATSSIPTISEVERFLDSHTAERSSA